MKKLIGLLLLCAAFSVKADDNDVVLLNGGTNWVAGNSTNIHAYKTTSGVGVQGGNLINAVGANNLTLSLSGSFVTAPTSNAPVVFWFGTSLNAQTVQTNAFSVTVTPTVGQKYVCLNVNIPAVATNGGFPYYNLSSVVDSNSIAFSNILVEAYAQHLK